MNVPLTPAGSVPFRSPGDTLGDIDIDVAAKLLESAGDVTLVIDASGVIRDVALGSNLVPAAWIDDWIDRSWTETVAIDSRGKVDEMLAAAVGNGPIRWRQINHNSARGDMPVRYLAFSIGKQGRVIAIGRDMRPEAVLQQRLLQAQQSMERDYVRLRQAEARYRMLFELSSEAVFVVDSATRNIIDANPAACQLTGKASSDLIGASLTGLLVEPSRNAALALLGTVIMAELSKPVEVYLNADGPPLLMAASLFRQDRGACFLVRLMTLERGAVVEVQESRRIFDVLDRLPDAFVVTDDSLNIIAQNSAFLDLAQLARKDQALGQPLGRFLGRQGIDLNLLITQLREHGSVRNFGTIVRGVYDAQDEVEVSAVAVADSTQPCFGFSIRNVGRRLSDLPVTGYELPKSVEHLTGLVGRVSLKEIVRESSDLIERLCIEAALKYTEDNRASAAEILGLSRQSLYSKLHRHNLGNLRDGSEQD
jgi:transcriptional regulator PpsR